MYQSPDLLLVTSWKLSPLPTVTVFVCGLPCNKIMVILNVLGFELLKIYIFIQCFRQKYTDFFFKKEDSDFICLDDSKCQVHGCCVCYPMVQIKANNMRSLMHTKMPILVNHCFKIYRTILGLSSSQTLP